MKSEGERIMSRSACIGRVRLSFFSCSKTICASVTEVMSSPDLLSTMRSSEPSRTICEISSSVT